MLKDVELVERLKKGPAVLFLGQRYLALESGSDSLLKEVLRKYPPPLNNQTTGYSQILNRNFENAGKSGLAWADELCKKFSPPEWLKTVSSYPWNAVFASSIDSIWPACFRNEWRVISPIFEENTIPLDSRNQLNLHCTFLFGSVNRTNEEERPPLSIFELMKKKQVAVSLGRRLADILTPWGTFFIEGHSGSDDWFSLSDLLPIIDLLNEHQTHIFSITEEFASNPLVKMLIDNNKIQLHQNSLANFLIEANGNGYINLGESPENIGSGRRIYIEKKPVSLPKDNLQNISRSANILDETTLKPPPPMSEEATYREFLRFLSAVGKPRWSDFARGFAFKREYQEKLEKVVKRCLESKRLGDEQIILHGQSGSGKTVSLEQLAFDICKEKKYPVLFIERSVQRPNPSELREFCKWADESGATSCLIIWDGMLAPKEYNDLLRYLTGRGRPVVLVGSSYVINEPRLISDPNYIPAPTKLSVYERGQFLEFLKKFYSSFSEMQSFMVADDFLVALYRLLPNTRSNIKDGLILEISKAESSLTGENRPIELLKTSILARALFAAGLIPDFPIINDVNIVVNEETMTEAQKLTGLIMVAGRFGLTIPFELLLRALGKNAYSKLPELFNNQDIFRWKSDHLGNIEVGPRNSLEADIIVSARLGGPQMEVSFAKELLIEVKASGHFTGDREVNFAVDLLRAMSAKGELSKSYSPYYYDLAKILRQLREERSFENPRIMLQEAHLLRLWVTNKEKRAEGVNQSDEALDQAEEVLNRALELTEGDEKWRDIRSHLLVELASTMSFKAQRLLESNKTLGNALSIFRTVRRLLADARMADPRNLYSPDRLSRIAPIFINSGTLPPDEKAETIAEVLYAFQVASAEELEPSERDHLDGNRLSFAQLVNINSLADEAFDALAARGSCAGYYLRALHMSGIQNTVIQTATGDFTQQINAFQYLQKNIALINKDVACLELYFDLWWIVKAKTKPFQIERLCPPFTENDWKECLKIIDDLEKTGQPSRPLRLSFLKGLAQFHLGFVDVAIRNFHDVYIEALGLHGRWRIINSFIASNPDGTPKKYHGDIAEILENGRRGIVYVDELRKEIKFITANFGRMDFVKRDALPEFHISFNFLGPIAEPVSYYQLPRL